jgi:hypothetical protein
MREAAITMDDSVCEHGGDLQTIGQNFDGEGRRGVKRRCWWREWIADGLGRIFRVMMFRVQLVRLQLRRMLLLQRV